MSDADIVERLESEVASLRRTLDEQLTENARLRTKNSEWHRQVQAADKAVRDAERCIQKITEGANQGTPWVGGSFGRALLAYGCKLRDDELTSLRAELAAMTAERDDLRAAIKEIDSVGMWLSAALDDENSCKEFKADIERYMQAMDRTGLFNDPIPTAPSKETGE